MEQSKFCVSCKKAVAFIKLLKGVEDAVFMTNYNYGRFAVCHNVKCPRYGLLSTMVDADGE